MLALILIFFTSLQFGCTPAPKVKITPFVPNFLSPKKNDIDVYTSEISIKKPYKEIALITIDDQGWEIDETELVKKLINEAKQIGADGIIILGQDVHTSGAVIVGRVIVSGKRRIVRGTAIVYIE